MTPIRLMADGNYVKVYVEEKRVANIPNADLGRTSVLRFEFEDVRDEQVFLGPIRLAAGGRDLYDRLKTGGRVATRGILFDTGSAELRPASTPTLKEIAQMLEQNPELQLRIEGHTDNTGSTEAYLDLSRERAENVKHFLESEYGVDGQRLEGVGKGEEEPVADNSTPEGQQQKRRVELVRLQ